MYISGGEDGKRGNNFLIRKNGRKIRLHSKSSVKVEKGVSEFTQKSSHISLLLLRYMLVCRKIHMKQSNIRKKKKFTHKISSSLTVYGVGLQ